LILPFEATYENPERTLRELAALTGLEPPSAEILERFRRYLKPELRHASESVKRPGRVLQLARSLFTIMTKEPAEVVTPIVQTLADRFRLERYMDDQAGEMRAYRDLIGPSIPDLLRDIDTSREPA
jgi:hypothetical protein